VYALVRALPRARDAIEESGHGVRIKFGLIESVSERGLGDLGLEKGHPSEERLRRTHAPGDADEGPLHDLAGCRNGANRDSPNVGSDRGNPD
jgi:hypothetical protein